MSALCGTRVTDCRPVRPRLMQLLPGHSIQKQQRPGITLASGRLRWVGQALSRDEELVQPPRYFADLCETAAIEFH
jgi:hypothetical protein